MYAATADMIARFGETEMILITTPRGTDLAGVVAATSDAALVEATDVVNGYVGRRYTVPLATVPSAVAGATMNVARYLLSLNNTGDPSESVRLANTQAMRWLGEIADGRVTIEGEPAVVDEGGAMSSDRRPQISGYRAGQPIPPQGYDPAWPTTW